MSENRDPERILGAARLIRSYLRQLLPVDKAESFDGIIAHILNTETLDVGVAAQRLDFLLATEVSTEAWLAQVLRDEQLRPPEFQEWEVRGADPLFHSQPVPAPKFVCPNGDYVRFLHSVGEKPLMCLTHDIELVPE